VTRRLRFEGGTVVPATLEATATLVDGAVVEVDPSPVADPPPPPPHPAATAVIVSPIAAILNPRTAAPYSRHRRARNCDTPVLGRQRLRRPA
jgi:hypothetical protein